MVDYSDLIALAVIPLALWYAVVARPLAPAALRYPLVALAVAAILGTSKAPPPTFPYQAVDNVSFASDTPIYDVALTPVLILERLRQADFTVKTGSVSTDVEILSGLTCQAGSADNRRVAHAQLMLRAEGDRSTVLVRRVLLCRRDRPWDHASAAAAFESEVLDRIGGGTRRP